MPRSRIERSWDNDWFSKTVALLEEVGRDQLWRHACEGFRRKPDLSALESGDVVMLRIVVGRAQNALVQAGVINGSVGSDRLANLWTRSDLVFQNASVDLLVV